MSESAGPAAETTPSGVAAKRQERKRSFNKSTGEASLRKSCHLITDEDEEEEQPMP